MFKKILVIIILLAIGYYAASSIVINGKFTNYVTTAGCASVMAMPLQKYYENYGLKTLSMYYLYPPLYYFTAVTAIKITGKNWALMTFLNNSFYLLVLVIFSYLLGKKLKDGVAGIIVALITLLYPLVYLGYITICIEFALAAFVAASIYFLVKSEYYGSLKYSIFLGIACGAGMLTKNTCAAFIIGPVLVGFSRVLWDIKCRKYARLLNFLIFAGVIFLIVYPSYGGFGSIMHNFTNQLTNEPTGLKWYSFEKLRPFLIGLSESQLTPIFFHTCPVKV